MIKTIGVTLTVLAVVSLSSPVWAEGGCGGRHKSAAQQVVDASGSQTKIPPKTSTATGG